MCRKTSIKILLGAQQQDARQFLHMMELSITIDVQAAGNTIALAVVVFSIKE